MIVRECLADETILVVSRSAAQLYAYNVEAFIESCYLMNVER